MGTVISLLLGCFSSGADRLAFLRTTSITNLDLLAELTHISVPSADACAFLRASIKNSSAFPLLPGRTSIYLDGTFVSKGDIRDVSPQETFELSLGIDGGALISCRRRCPLTALLKDALATTAQLCASLFTPRSVSSEPSKVFSLLPRSRQLHMLRRCEALS